MITRNHKKELTKSTAVYSNCELYRYSLTRSWDSSAKKVLFIMLNPSTATEIQNDPTVERCERRAKALGYGAFKVCNIFAYRSTDPKIMRLQKDTIGPETDQIIIKSANWSNNIICAWGTNGSHLNRGKKIEELLRAKNFTLTHLGLSKDGHPKHPLYISYKVCPENWIER